MKETKKSESKPVQNAEEVVTPVLLARLAAKISPTLCLNDPKQAIEAAARLIEFAREWSDKQTRQADEKTELEALAKHYDKYGFKPGGGNLSLADAFRLQQEERFWKGKRREGPYKNKPAFIAALRQERLTFTDLPKGTEEIFVDRTKGMCQEPVEETTEEAVEGLFERLVQRRTQGDKERKRAVKQKKHTEG